ncbi:hypothetical protein A0H81_07894 [Grifola frondosa]|uniref:Uncharacterized protein n=1 Tax=Grifola frondosa TaxID=5627 RepID=A0A1C7M883_GRIFR|nr:hypothetical protein A0H81_07894 [Grifola frondosa]
MSQPSPLTILTPSLLSLETRLLSWGITIPHLISAQGITTPSLVFPSTWALTKKPGVPITISLHIRLTPAASAAHSSPPSRAMFEPSGALEQHWVEFSIEAPSIGKVHLCVLILWASLSLVDVTCHLFAFLLLLNTLPLFPALICPLPPRAAHILATTPTYTILHAHAVALNLDGKPSTWMLYSGPLHYLSIGQYIQLDSPVTEAPNLNLHVQGQLYGVRSMDFDCLEFYVIS